MTMAMTTAMPLIALIAAAMATCNLKFHSDTLHWGPTDSTLSVVAPISDDRMHAGYPHERV